MCLDSDEWDDLEGPAFDAMDVREILAECLGLDLSQEGPDGAIPWPQLNNPETQTEEVE